jgi:hypothetical protein
MLHAGCFHPAGVAFHPGVLAKKHTPRKQWRQVMGFCCQALVTAAVSWDDVNWFRKKNEEAMCE